MAYTWPLLYKAFKMNKILAKNIIINYLNNI
jgi:hypothetical protein